jgi:hypothetical protein
VPRALLCITIVAAFQTSAAAAAPGIAEVTVPPHVIAAAESLGLDWVRDRALLLPELIRLLYTPPEGRQRQPFDVLQQAPHIEASGLNDPGDALDASLTIPVPLGAAAWSRILRRDVSDSALVGAIVADRKAALIAYGLSGVDDETLAYFADHPDVLAPLYQHERAAPAFAAFGASLRIENRRVAPAGGADAVPLWEAVVRARVSAPEKFIRALFGEHDGRLAYLHDVLSALGPAASAFVFGTGVSGARRLELFRQLADTAINSYREWRVVELPFSRPLNDLGLLLFRARIEPSGELEAPADRGFWAEVFDEGGAVREPGTVAGREGLVTAPWLVAVVSEGGMFSRADRLDQLAFVQRVFPRAGSSVLPDVLAAAKAFPRYRMLMLSLERIGIRTPAVYAAAVAHATAASTVDPARRFWTLAQFQGALAAIVRMRQAGTIDASRAEALVGSLIALPVNQEDGYGGAIAAWIGAELVPPPHSDAIEQRLIAGLAGPTPRTSALIEWEGHQYRLDLSFAERRRLELVREKQGGPTLDVALSVAGLVRDLGKPSPTMELAGRSAERLRDLARDNAFSLKRPSVTLAVPGVQVMPDALDWVTRSAEDLTRAARSADTRRIHRVVASLTELVDILTGHALLSIAYAAAIGDADGSALLGANVALRHDFGFLRRDGESRARAPWALPRQEFQPGVPWHVTGSLLGLDVALAPLGLRRLTMDRLADAPRLSSTEREAFAVNVGLMEPRRLRDTDQRLISAAVARGRERVRALAAGAEALGAVAKELALDTRRHRALAWLRTHDPDALAGAFSLAELLVLGGGAAGADLDAWGVSGLYSWGCACTRFATPRTWPVLAGRLQLPLMAAMMVDLHLQVALLLDQMGLPAALARTVLMVAVQDFIDEVGPTDGNDWRALSRRAQQLDRRRVEDYVAVAAAVDGAFVPEENGSARQP